MNWIVKYSKRFFRALFPKLTPGDIEFIRAHLSKQEQILFYRMPRIDQKHCLNTAYIIDNKRSTKVNQKMLIKVALLHDIGKVNWVPPIRFRVYSTLLDLIMPPLAKFLAKKGKSEKAGKLARSLYIKKEHGPLGTKILKELDWGDTPLFILAHHHDKIFQKKSPEIEMLQEADELS